MAIDLSTLTKTTPTQRRNALSRDAAGKPKPEAGPQYVVEGLHAGTVDMSQAGLLAYHGVGLNKHALYGVRHGTAKFLLACEEYPDHPDWGSILTGEFRLGDDVSGDGSGGLTGNSWIRFNPSTDILELKGMTIHVDSAYGGIHAGPTNPTDGCGLNQYGVYGMDAGTGIFLLLAEDITGNADWGDGVTGEFRVGDNVEESGGTLLGSHWLWYHPTNGLKVKGAQQTIDPTVHTTANAYFHAGTYDEAGGHLATDGCGVNPWGVYGMDSGSPAFILCANDMVANATWGNVVTGEFRAGHNVKESGGTLLGDSWLWWHPTNGLAIKMDWSNVGGTDIPDANADVTGSNTASDVRYVTGGTLALYAQTPAADTYRVDGTLRLGGDLDVHNNSDIYFFHSNGSTTIGRIYNSSEDLLVEAIYDGLGLYAKGNVLIEPGRSGTGSTYIDGGDAAVYLIGTAKHLVPDTTGWSFGSATYPIQYLYIGPSGSYDWRLQGDTSGNFRFDYGSTNKAYFTSAGALVLGSGLTCTSISNSGNVTADHRYFNGTGYDIGGSTNRVDDLHVTDIYTVAGWQIASVSGGMGWYLSGAQKMSLTSGGSIFITGTVTENHTF